jgi:hypothetical protein
MFGPQVIYFNVFLMLACVIAETILGEPIFPGRSATE